MRRLLILLPILLLLLPSLYAQTGGETTTNPPDDMPFAMIIAVAFLSLSIGCILIGAGAAVIALGFLTVFITTGIVSASILAGIYKRSVTAAFRTLIYTCCCLGGVITGIVGILIINKLFHLNLSSPVWASIGITAGALGGLLLGTSILLILRLFINFAKQRLRITF